MGRTKKSRRYNVAKHSYSFKFGKFTARNVCLEEISINDVVLRVHLKNENVNGKKPSFSPIKRKKLIFSHDPTESEVTKRTLQMSPVSSRSLCLSSLRQKMMTSLGKDVSFSARRIRKPFRIVELTKKSFHQCKKYYLEFQCKSSYAPIKVTLDFMKLSEHVCVMKLPSQKWDIKVTMNQDLTTIFHFTTLSKSVICTQATSNCDLRFNGEKAWLLGCPETVETFKDLEILLDIVNRLEISDCMVTRL